MRDDLRLKLIRLYSLLYLLLDAFFSGLMRKEHPGVALSVKTHQAIRSVLNHSRDTIKQLLGGGVLDESDAEKLLLVSQVAGKLTRRELGILLKCEDYLKFSRFGTYFHHV